MPIVDQSLNPVRCALLVADRRLQQKFCLHLRRLCMQPLDVVFGKLGIVRRHGLAGNRELFARLRLLGSDIPRQQGGHGDRSKPVPTWAHQASLSGVATEASYDCHQRHRCRPSADRAVY